MRQRGLDEIAPRLAEKPARGTFGTWELMASDHSQFMTAYTRRALGWIVPRTLVDGEHTLRLVLREDAVKYRDAFGKTPVRTRGARSGRSGTTSGSSQRRSAWPSSQGLGPWVRHAVRRQRLGGPAAAGAASVQA